MVEIRRGGRQHALADLGDGLPRQGRDIKLLDQAVDVGQVDPELAVPPAPDLGVAAEVDRGRDGGLQRCSTTQCHCQSYNRMIYRYMPAQPSH